MNSIKESVEEKESSFDATELRLGNWDLAVAAYRRAIALGYDSANASKGIAWAHYNAGRDAEALAMFEAASALFAAKNDPDESVHMADCHKGRWLVYQRRGECAAAELAGSRARSLAPEIALPAADCRSLPSASW